MQKKESTNKATNSLYELYCALGIAIGEVVTHPDCPAWFHNELTAVVSEAVNRASSIKPRHLDMFYAHNLKDFMHILAGAEKQDGRDSL